MLVCPMDWGLGHASRCVPVIRAFVDAGCHVVVAAGGGGRQLIEKEFGTGKGGEAAGSFQRPLFVDFPGFRVSWPGRFPLLKFILRLPSFLLHIRRERRALARLVREHGAGIVVSDNRYGLVHEGVVSVMITHQLRPSLPPVLRVMEGLVAMVVRRMVSRFDECWIPDCPGAPTAGALAGGWERLPSAVFVGRLSRFAITETNGRVNGQRESVPAGPSGEVGEGAVEKAGSNSGREQVVFGELGKYGGYRFLFVMSGPEPQRSLFEEKVREIMRGRGDRSLLVRGVPGGNIEGEGGGYLAASSGELEVVPFLDGRGLMKAMEMSELVVCRSGYSSVTDLLVAAKRAVLVPTPGQTEQEYLGRWLDGKGGFRVIKQRELTMERLMEVLEAGEAGHSRDSFGKMQAGVKDQCNDGTLLLTQVAAVIERCCSDGSRH